MPRLYRGYIIVQIIICVVLCVIIANILSLEPIVEPPKPIEKPEIRYYTVIDKEKTTRITPQVMIINKVVITTYHQVTDYKIILNDNSTIYSSSLYNQIKIGDTLKATITTGWFGIKNWQWSIYK
jgi:hypothetical protein